MKKEKELPQSFDMVLSEVHRTACSKKKLYQYSPALLNLTLGPNPLQPFCFLPRPVFTKALGLDLLGLGGGQALLPRSPYKPVTLPP